MKAEEWFKRRLEEFKDDIDFKTEGVILDLTEKIVKIMNRNGISRADLADRMHVSRPFITKILNGYPNMTLKTMVSIADALACELNVTLPCKIATMSDYQKKTIKRLIKLSPEEDANAA